MSFPKDNEATKKIVLLDTHAILHRAYHAMPDFTSDDGEPTGALYGLTTMLFSIIKEFKPYAIVACYDLPEATFRHKEYKEYKAGRQKADDALIAQLESSKKIFKAFNIPMVSAPGFEADDMLGTIVEQVFPQSIKHKTENTKTKQNTKHKAQNSRMDDTPYALRPTPYQIVIASGDMDTLQLVDDDRVVVYTLRKGIKDTVLYDEKQVVERFGFPPKLLTDYKGLRGDPSDNIPGVPGIGEKTATGLIVKFGTLEDMYELLEKHKAENTKTKQSTKQKSQKRPKGKEKDERGEGEECTNCQLPIADCRIAGLKPRTVELLRAHKDEAMFSKMLATIRRDAPVVFELEPQPFATRFEPAKVEELFKKLSFRSLIPRIASLNMNENWQMKSVKNDKKSAGAETPVDKTDTASQNGSETEKGVEHGLGFGQMSNVKSQMSVAASPSVSEAELERLRLAYWLLDPGHHELSAEAIFRHTGAKEAKEAEEKLLAELADKGLLTVYKEIELPLVPILAQAKERGVLVDRHILERLSKEYHKVLSGLEKEIWKLGGEEFNVNSPKQLGGIVFEKLGLGGPKTKRTASGQISTKVSELEKLKGTHPIVDAIMQHREYQKLLSTYIDAIPPLLDAESRLHTTLVQTGAATGRMSSVDPNLQNIPIKTELGRAIREAFVATPGYVLAAFDYSQIDLRSAAILSGDPLFLKIFKEGADVHAGVASAVFGVAPEAVDREMRRRAKVINFGILYGMGVRALQQNLGTGRAEAEDFYKKYFERFHGLREYLDKVKEEAHRNGYTTTHYGRRRYYPKIRSKITYLRSMEERMAMNAPIQGTTADIIKIAMGRVPGALAREKLEGDVHVLLQVHDELMYEIKKEKVDEAVTVIKKVMEEVITEPIPFPVKVSVGPNWSRLEEFGK